MLVPVISKKYVVLILKVSKSMNKATASFVARIYRPHMTNGNGTEKLASQQQSVVVGLRVDVGDTLRSTIKWLYSTRLINDQRPTAKLEQADEGNKPF